MYCVRSENGSRCTPRTQHGRVPHPSMSCPSSSLGRDMDVSLLIPRPRHGRVPPRPSDATWTRPLDAALTYPLDAITLYRLVRNRVPDPDVPPDVQLRYPPGARCVGPPGARRVKPPCCSAWCTIACPTMSYNRAVPPVVLPGARLRCTPLSYRLVRNRAVTPVVPPGARSRCNPCRTA